MKKYLMFLIVALSTCSVESVIGQSPTVAVYSDQLPLQDRLKSIKDLLPLIAKKHPEIIVGWEFGSSGRNALSNPTQFLAAIEENNLARISGLIEEQTDYECLADTNNFIVVPKLGPDKSAIPLVKRQVVYSEANNLPVSDFLAILKGIDGTRNRVFISLPRTSPLGIRGSITVEQGRTECYKVFNLISRQLKAKSWILIHWTATNDEMGEVTFQPTGEVTHWIE